MVNDAIRLLRVVDQGRLVADSKQVVRSEVGSVQEGAVTAYWIQDLDEDTDVVVSNGEAWVDEGYLLYRPAQTGPGGFSVDGLTYEVEVDDLKPVTPVITIPRNGRTTSFNDLEAEVDAVFINHPDYYGLGTTWQISDDESFTNILHETTDLEGLKRLLYEGLEYGNTYYLRARVFANRPD